MLFISILRGNIKLFIDMSGLGKTKRLIIR